MLPKIILDRVLVCALITGVGGYAIVSNAGSAVHDAHGHSLMILKAPPPPNSNALAVAYDCLASLALHAKGIKNVIERAIADANVLEKLMVMDSTRRSGWPYIQDDTEKHKQCGQPGSLDAFGDGTCNPPETPYMIQTGYAVACLAQLHIATGTEKYVDLAKKAVSDSWNLGSALQGCKNCFSYWYSYHPNDLNRYVRNTNLIMGLGVAWLYAATGQALYRDRALAVARAENREIRAGNFGYFGIDDPRYRANPKMESQRIENHIPHQVKALNDIGSLMKDRQTKDDAKTMLDAFLNCSNARCRPDNCKAWAAPASCKATATIAPCILADQGEPYQSRCQDVLKAIPRLNAFQIVLLYSSKDIERSMPRSNR
jgi:hypothetical protein